MGIESDRIVDAYLDRVGDLARRQGLGPDARSRLLDGLSEEIGRRRGGTGPDDPESVRRLVLEFGTPEEVVSAAGPAATPLLPRPRTEDDGDGPGAAADRAEADAYEDGGAPPAWPDASAPHMLGLGGEGSDGGDPGWWRVRPGPFGDGVRVPGFVGGVEIPELLKPPPGPDDEPPGEQDAETGDSAVEAVEQAGGGTAGEAGEAPPRRRRLLPGRRRRGPAPAPVAEAPAPSRRRIGQPLLLLAAALLVAGAVAGSWLALAGGWLLAYSSRTLSRAEAKWVAMGLPSVVVAGALVWVWGRLDGRWGDPIAEGATGEVLTGLWPVVVRTAAVVSALYLVWRARRARG
ncbi:hypothetical protein [uncultured Streptomyces sp.]|uniref:hypothetical protein n=1 Tax=uncultured Streptomyces sp. TaxID=174707 RepID=UPI0026068965|nr:hypothetical protein [uncultured Streptomyces sp.]